MKTRDIFWENVSYFLLIAYFLKIHRVYDKEDIEAKEMKLTL